jgi:phage virion morphogenesis protein
MDGITLTIDASRLHDFARLLSVTAERARDMTPLMGAVARYGEESTRLRFRDETGPDGQRWLPSFRARTEGGQTLSKSGQLRDTLTSEFSSNRAAWGSNKIYAAVHQFGATIRAKSGGRLKFKLPGIGFVSPEEVTIPARPFLGFNADDRAEISDLAEGYFLGGWS